MLLADISCKMSMLKVDLFADNTRFIYIAVTDPENEILPWRNNVYAQQYFSCEREFLSSGLRQAIGPIALQLGQQLDQSVIDELDLPFLVRTSRTADGPGDVAADPAFLPFDQDSFAMVILPHTLERHLQPHQVLREAHRVMMSEGHIVVTGFNPMSFMGLQRFLRPDAVAHGRYYTPKRVIDWLQLLGFEVVASSMFQYAPLSKKPGMRRSLRFLESIGDRWLPMFGGGYMIAAKKRDAGTTMVGRLKFKTSKRKLAASASSARTRS